MNLEVYGTVSYLFVVVATWLYEFAKTYRMVHYRREFSCT